MVVVQLEDSFMDSLFAELDASIFDSSPLRPPPPPPPPISTRRRPLVASSSPTRERKNVLLRKDENRFRISSSTRNTTTMGVEVRRGSQRQSQNEGGEERSSTQKKRKYVKIEVESEITSNTSSSWRRDQNEKENVVPTPLLPVSKVKREEDPVAAVVVVDHHGGRGVEVNYDDLLEGMDFEDEDGALLWSSQFQDQTIQQQDDDPVVPLIAQGKQFLRCTVSEIIPGKTASTKVLMISVVDGGPALTAQYSILLCDDWIQTPVESGDIINLIGEFDPTATPSMSLTRSQNLLILHPDLLVSSTKVADTSSCARRALLQEIIRSSGGQSSEALIYGNMLHELMQVCFTQQRWDTAWREEQIEVILKKEVGGMWTLGLEVAQARQGMRDRSQGFEKFSQLFVGETPKNEAILSDSRAPVDDPLRLAITQTCDIEEDIWSPKYGLKGKVDVSVMGRFKGGGEDEEGENKVIPFEIKTGRAVAGNEHRAQTMLYTLLMSDRYDESITSGLLYYSNTSEVYHVRAARNEIRGLIIVRNEFATYLHRRTRLSRMSGSKPTQSQFSIGPSTFKNEEIEKTPCKEFDIVEEMNRDEREAQELKTAEEEENTRGELQTMMELGENGGRPLLPEPIDEVRSCKRCYAGEACMLYRRAVEGDEFISEEEDDPLQILFNERTSFLTETHLTFFKQWERLINLEEQEMLRFKKEIWTMGAEERMKVGRCIANVSIDASFEPPPLVPGAKIHLFTYRLALVNPPSTNATASQVRAASLLGGNIAVGDPVVISLETPSVLAIARGFVLAVGIYSVDLGLDHSLVDNAQAARRRPRLPESELVFRIDKDELAAGMGRIRDNLIQLFLKDGDLKRRRLIVDLERPRFDKPVRAEAIDEDRRERGLNVDQERAIEKVLSARDYALILGMPGTGKTTTIAAIMKALVKEGKSVLLTSYTHSAVDNILLKVMDEEDFTILRLGNRDKIMPILHKFTLDPSNPPTSISDLNHLYESPQVVATTCLSINEVIFTRRKFDVCIVDEASQVTLPTCLGPLRFADVFVLVGDHQQLPPLVRNPAAKKGGLDVSLFKRLSVAHPSAVVYLTMQYRMSEDIMLLSNQLIYQDRLKVGNLDVAQQYLRLPQKEEGLKKVCRHGGKEGVGNRCWIEEILEQKRNVVFVDTDLLPARELKSGTLIENEIEAVLVHQITTALIECGLAEAEIGIIALYRQQIKLIARRVMNYPGVEVLTADKSQGRDKECIIMSLTRSNEYGSVGDLLKDWRRINVCLTRAKSKLIVFGSRSTLTHIPLLKKFFDIVADKEWICQLQSGDVELHSVSLGSSGADLEERREEGVKESKRIRNGMGGKVVSEPLCRDILNSV